MGWLILLAALGGVAGWLFAQRLRIVEERLRRSPTRDELAALDVPKLAMKLRGQQGRLQRIREAFENVQRDRESTEAELRAAKEEAAGLAGQVDELRRVVDALQAEVRGLRDERAGPTGASVAAGSGELEPRICEALAEEGFEDSRILGPIPEAGQEGRVVVEARRAGAAYKGTVRVEAGDLSLHLTPCYKVFP